MADTDTSFPPTLIALQRGTPEYEERRQSAARFQRLVLTKSPAIWFVVRKVPEDLQAILNHSIAFNHKLTILAGGHSSFSINDDSLVVDLSDLKHSCITQNEVGEHLISLQPGLTLGEIADITSPVGFQIPMGIISHTGFGLILGGGVGWLSRLYGLSCDHIVSLKAVDGHGQTIEIEGDQLNSWKGNPGTNGIVYEALLRGHPVCSPFVTVLAFPLGEIAALVFEKVSAFLESPDARAELRATTYMIFDFAPDRSKCFTVAMVFVGPEDEGKAFFASIFALGGHTVVSAVLPWPALARA